MANKKRVNISISQDTEERLKQYAFENHTTVSQAITDWIWSVKVRGENIRGQQSLDLAGKGATGKGKSMRDYAAEIARMKGGEAE